MNMGLLADFPFGVADAKPERLFVEVRESISFVRMAPGERVKTRIHLRNVDGVPIDVDPSTLSWKSKDEGIATADGDGMILAHMSGVAEVCASYTRNDTTVSTFVHVIVE